MFTKILHFVPCLRTDTRLFYGNVDTEWIEFFGASNNEGHK